MTSMTMILSAQIYTVKGKMFWVFKFLFVLILCDISNLLNEYNHNLHFRNAEISFCLYVCRKGNDFSKLHWAL